MQALPTPTPAERLDAALTRLESAARELSSRHDRLRDEVKGSLVDLDRLMERSSGG